MACFNLLLVLYAFLVMCMPTSIHADASILGFNFVTIPLTTGTFVYKVSLSTQPTTDVILTPNVLNTTILTVAETSLTFSSFTYNVPQFLTIATVSLGSTFLTLSAAGASEYATKTLTTSVSVSYPAIMSTWSNQTYTTSSYSVPMPVSFFLNVPPSSPVTLTLTNSIGSISPTTLTFDKTNFSIIQTAMFSCNVVSRGAVTATASQAGGGKEFEGVTFSVLVFAMSSILQIPSPRSYAPNTNGFKLFVSIIVPPSAPLTITMTTSDSGKIGITSSKITYTGDNWLIPQNFVLNTFGTGSVNLTFTTSGANEFASKTVSVTIMAATAQFIYSTTWAIYSFGLVGNSISLSTEPSTPVIASFSSNNESIIKPSIPSITMQGWMEDQYARITMFGQTFTKPGTEGLATITFILTQPGGEYHGKTGTFIFALGPIAKMNLMVSTANFFYTLFPGMTDSNTITLNGPSASFQPTCTGNLNGIASLSLSGRAFTMNGLALGQAVCQLNVPDSSSPYAGKLQYIRMFVIEPQLKVQNTITLALGSSNVYVELRFNRGAKEGNTGTLEVTFANNAIGSGMGSWAGGASYTGVYFNATQLGSTIVTIKATANSVDYANKVVTTEVVVVPARITPISTQMTTVFPYTSFLYGISGLTQYIINNRFAFTMVCNSSNVNIGTVQTLNIIGTSDKGLSSVMVTRKAFGSVTVSCYVNHTLNNQPLEYNGITVKFSVTFLPNVFILTSQPIDFGGVLNGQATVTASLTSFFTSSFYFGYTEIYVTSEDPTVANLGSSVVKLGFTGPDIPQVINVTSTALGSTRLILWASNSTVPNNTILISNSVPCSSPCQNGGSCTVSGSCHCDAAWTDSTCSTSACASNPCQHGGTCTGPNTCSCPDAAWTGSNCATSACASNPCQHGGTCTGPNICSCPDAAWTGSDCSTSACASNPCQHGGTCTGPNTCSCSDAAWTGSDCSTSACASSPCQNGGMCIGANTCTCTGGWTGPTCTIAPPTSDTTTTTATTTTSAGTTTTTTSTSSATPATTTTSDGTTTTSTSSATPAAATTTATTSTSSATPATMTTTSTSSATPAAATTTSDGTTSTSAATTSTSSATPAAATTTSDGTTTFTSSAAPAATTTTSDGTTSASAETTSTSSTPASTSTSATPASGSTSVIPASTSSTSAAASGSSSATPASTSSTSAAAPATTSTSAVASTTTTTTTATTSTTSTLSSTSTTGQAAQIFVIQLARDFESESEDVDVSGYESLLAAELGLPPQDVNAFVEWYFKRVAARRGKLVANITMHDTQGLGVEDIKARVIQTANSSSVFEYFESRNVTLSSSVQTVVSVIKITETRATTSTSTAPSQNKSNKTRNIKIGVSIGGSIFVVAAIAGVVAYFHFKKERNVQKSSSVRMNNVDNNI